ncbi:furin-like protease 1, isoforms 1/1-X/2 isoform X1 [Drosophila subpulchrella]|uniref:furin-like protease 1, isoforms 1/1-X/2 isoform X1 n=1 Tax=Drosophila subpulchrella TaxID=1486046 RepID=UPI0018A189EE|nr:furin-like protease 1, isoforms 1/1-X/2 isoform X1 [Drosophila subpulchrella]XP_037714415.1 furin-like protease 1, isoforms 1/1-X/2 isoform X1 [Drosophila subpulchrella]XP_037714425.1 furin-like protease 1, isoforms 1/1-X/2 isoform X1 [Drosophila subpulchrella]XP_037714432.1 furin-like protease 1, isoforms 1/1-X/2 isoform X1 [Drosophila subpulchrella]XP_037714441.1 furin-like protease 1, isoforms 1/1-X/2 isoform X1 [Drosophila subpulchrella]XP_037714449.1 furin-like protease 1, isoforms 1/1
MKNDVVRWSRQPTSNINSSNISSSNCRSGNSNSSNISSHKHRSKSNKLNARQLEPHAARSCRQREEKKEEQQQTIIECDIGNFNFDCNLFKTSFLTHHKPKLSGNSKSRSRCTNSSSRHLAKTKAVLLLALQFSAVVFLCNFNVGFVAGSVATAASSASGSSPSTSSPPAPPAAPPPQPPSSPLKVDPNGQSPVLPPYILDYETGGRAKLTPNSGKYGQSGSSGSNNQIVGHYTHTWAVHIPNGDNGMADDVAKDHGFVNLGKIFDDHYHFAHHKVSKRSLSPATHHQTRLDDDDRVHWAKQQRAKSRSKRDFIRMRPSRTSSRAMSMVDAMPFDDSKWPQMWYLNRGGGLDMNVIPAWKQGITGRGVVVTILDDGLESDHPDITDNYDPKASYDVNSHDDDPMPHYDMTDSNRHGTRCAGEVAATANNSFCAVGIAYGASVGGVRMLDGDVTDAVEARSLSLNPQHIDIYSASWGPDDDGKTVDGPGELASRAFIEGTTKGRGGKGSIFIWASGNGGREQDNCNCDGYTNSIWTLSISSATEEGHVPWYSEKCSSTLATTYSSGGQGEKQVVTTDLHHSCTVSHTGTSASAPLAAGIAALVLQSNQNLTWRDLQHIVVRTAKPANLKDPSWSRNGVGRRVSHSFGYGLMDAAEMVRVARSWKSVPEQQRCEINAPHVDKVIPPRTHITLQLTVNHCRSVNYLEHVQAKITLTSQRRGDIQLYLRSPANTSVTLLTPRVHDNSRSGFNQWPFMSVHTWGESPQGNWQLEIHNEGRYMGHALLREWSLIFYGTTQSIDPNDPISVPRPSGSEATTPNSSSTTSNLHQAYSPQYPRIPPNNFGSSPSGGSKLPLGKVPPPNKSTYVTNNPLLNPASPKQGYQQISATYGVILGKANGKANNNSKEKTNNKGNKANNGNKGKSGGSGGGNRKEQTTQSSIIQTSTSKNKYYRISQQQQQKNNKQDRNGVQTQRPKANSGEKSYDEKSRKVVGEITTTNGSNGSIKAAKQVKESTTSSSTSNSRIPKLFERYEKIQAIFPELEPYENSSPKGKAKQAKQGKQFEVELFRPTIGGNSRQGNTKKSPSVPPPSQTMATLSILPILPAGGSSFLPDQKILKKQQLLMAAAGVMAPAQVEVEMEEVQATPDYEEPRDHRKEVNGPNAQITQWDMIFYGTETPAQPEDVANPSQTNQFNLYGNDMAHNDIEYDSTGQWRNMQQVGEVGMARDHSNTAACLKWSDRKCLECNDTAYMYEDLCYDVCPVHTYPIDKFEVDEEDLDDDVSRGPVNPYSSPTTDHPSVVSNSIDDKQDPLQAEDRRRRRRSRTFITESPLTPLVETPARICAVCDRSCLACHGPLVSQCSTCSPGSQLRKISNETFCYAYVVRSTGLASVVEISEMGDRSTQQYMTGTTVLLLVSVVFTLMGVAVAGGIVYHRRAMARSNELYSRVSLMAGDESDSDNEDELFRAHFLGKKNDVIEYRDEAPSEKISEKEEISHLVP